MKLSLNKAAKEAGVAKSTILEAIKTKRMSAPKNERGHYEIDPSELFRVFPKTGQIQTSEPNPTPAESRQENNVLEREVMLLREMLEETRADRDQWREQAQKVTALIEGRTEKRGTRWFWQKKR